MVSYNYAKGYCIQLGNENNWWVTGYENGKGYADTFAEIMKLKECPLNEYPKIVFFESSSLNQISEKDIETVFPDSLNKWKTYDHNNFKIWHCLKSNNIAIEYKSEKLSKDDKYSAMWILLSFVFLKCLKTGALPTHSGLAEYKGKGVLFAASGGTGKSTTCRRLPSPWKVLSDDENLIMPEGNNKYRVHPFPTWGDYLWNRSKNKWDIHQSVPLSTIFFLERSDNDEVERLSRDKSSLFMTGTAYQVLAKAIKSMDKDNQAAIMGKIFNNAFDISKSIPIYKLKISLTGRFWEKVEEILT